MTDEVINPEYKWLQDNRDELELNDYEMNVFRRFLACVTEANTEELKAYLENLQGMVRNLFNKDVDQKYWVSQIPEPRKKNILRSIYVFFIIREILYREKGSRDIEYNRAFKNDLEELMKDYEDKWTKDKNLNKLRVKFYIAVKLLEPKVPGVKNKITNGNLYVTTCGLLEGTSKLYIHGKFESKEAEFRWEVFLKNFKLQKLERKKRKTNEESLVNKRNRTN